MGVCQAKISEINPGSNCSIDYQTLHNISPLLVNHSPNGIIITDFALNIIYSNHSIHQLTGYTQNELIGNALNAVFSAESFDPVKPQLLPVVRENGNWQGELQLVCKDGTLFWKEIAVVPFVFKGKNSVFVLICDMFDRKGVEHIVEDQTLELKNQLTYARALNSLAELIISTEDAQIILDGMTTIIGHTLKMDHCSVYSVNFSQGKFRLEYQYAKNAASNILVPDNQCMLNLSTSTQLFFREHKHYFESHIDEMSSNLSNSGMAHIIHDVFKINSFFWYPFSYGQDRYYGLAFDQMEAKRTLKDGEMEFLYSAIKLAESALQKIHCVNKRRETEDVLIKGEYEKDLILSSISEIVVFHDQNMKIKWANAAAESKGVSIDELIGYHCYEKWHGLDRPCPNCPVQRTLETGERYSAETVIPEGDVISVKAFPVINEEGILIGAVHVSRNITESKKIEEEMARLERMNLIGEMAAGFGHEIRNPLATVKGFLQILYGKEDCTRYREFLDLMIEEMDRANSIISEFLSMAKHKAIDLKAHNLVQIIQSLFPLMLADAIHGDKSIELELQDVPHVQVDKKETHQLILNLVRNGLEAMSSGGCLTIKTYSDGDQVVLAIQDEGGGIHPEVMKKLGIPFVTTKENGTGLGLAICYSIVQRHRAKMDVESGPFGTTFYIRYNRTA